jgi:oxygen-dependent protoporphyrinogen oxidase
VLIGGATDPRAVELDDDDLLALALRDLETTVGIAVDPGFAGVVRHRAGIPQYTLGHLERVAAIDTLAAGSPGLFLHGNGYRGIALNDVLRQAPQVAQRVLARVE